MNICIISNHKLCNIHVESGNRRVCLDYIRKRNCSYLLYDKNNELTIQSEYSEEVWVEFLMHFFYAGILEVFLHLFG